MLKGLRQLHSFDSSSSDPGPSRSPKPSSRRSDASSLASPLRTPGGSPEKENKPRRGSLTRIRSFSSGLVAVARPGKSAAREWNDLGRPYTINPTGVYAVISRKDQNGRDEFVEVPCDIKPAEAIRRNLAFEGANGLGPSKKREVLQANLPISDRNGGSPGGLPRVGTLKCKKSFFRGDEEERAALAELGFLVGPRMVLDKTSPKLERTNLRLERNPPIYDKFCTLPDLPSFEPLLSSPTKART